MNKKAEDFAPKLRFPEYRDSFTWKIKKLNELLFEPKLRNRNLEYSRNEVLSVSGEHGCVNQIELLGRSFAGVSVKDYHVVASGDIVYTKSPLKKNPYGIIKENKGQAGIVSTLYAVYRVTDSAISAYIDHYFSRDYNLNSYLQPIADIDQTKTSFFYFEYSSLICHSVSYSLNFRGQYEIKNQTVRPSWHCSWRH